MEELSISDLRAAYEHSKQWAQTFNESIQLYRDNKFKIPDTDLKRQKFWNDKTTEFDLELQRRIINL